MWLIQATDKRPLARTNIPSPFPKPKNTQYYSIIPGYFTKTNGLKSCPTLSLVNTFPSSNSSQRHCAHSLHFHDGKSKVPAPMATRATPSHHNNTRNRLSPSLYSTYWWADLSICVYPVSPLLALSVGRAIGLRVSVGSICGGL